MIEIDDGNILSLIFHLIENEMFYFTHVEYNMCAKFGTFFNGPRYLALDVSSEQINLDFFVLDVRKHNLTDTRIFSDASILRHPNQQFIGTIFFMI